MAKTSPKLQDSFFLVYLGHTYEIIVCPRGKGDRRYHDAGQGPDN